MKSSKSLISLAIGLVLLFSWSALYSILYLPNSIIQERAFVGYATPINSEKEITLADGSCRKITSTTNTQYYIPTQTMGESSAFITNPPTGVSVGACGAAGACHFSSSLETSTMYKVTYPWICGPSIDGQEVWKYTTDMLWIYYKVKCVCTGSSSTLSAPTLLPGVAWNTSVALSWTAPAGIIGDYIVEYKTTAWATWLVFNDGISIATTANVTGLTNGTSYDFRVKTKNGNGESGPSNVISATPVGAPSCGLTASILPSYPSPDSGVPNPPTTQLCSDWSAPSVTSTTSLFSWTCGAASCSVPRDCILKYRANIFALWQEDGMSLGSIRDMSSALIVDISSDPRIAMIAFWPWINRYSCGIVPSNSCAPAPACIGAGHCTQTANAPTSVGQAWTAGWLQCGFTCSPGWSGDDCNTAVSCFDARQYSVWRHCDIGGNWSWMDQRSDGIRSTPFLFGRVGYTGLPDFFGQLNTTDNFDSMLCKGWASPIQSGDYGYSCPPWSITNWGGCYYPNTDPRRPTECDSSDPSDECCFFVCPATLACTAGTCGAANGTTVLAYPSWAQLCTSGNTQNIDSIAADGTYNWGCGSTSCSANRDNTIWPFCNGIAKPTVDGGRQPRCNGGTNKCEDGNASWQCQWAGWVWNIQDHMCVQANQVCP